MEPSDLKRLNRDVIDRAMGRICLMKFFPASDVVARATVMVELIEMCSTDEQVEWLSKRVTALYTEWPGLRELRAVFCSKYKPLDGIEANSADSRFIDGIPSENPQTEWKPRELEPGEQRRLLTGDVEQEQVSVDLELATLVHDIAVKATMPTVERRSVQEISQMLYGRYGKVHAATGNSTNPSPKTTAPGSESATPTIGSAKRITQADIDAELRAACRPTSAEERPRNIAGLGVGE